MLCHNALEFLVLNERETVDREVINRVVEREAAFAVPA